MCNCEEAAAARLVASEDCREVVTSVRRVALFLRVSKLSENCTVKLSRKSSASVHGGWGGEYTPRTHET